MHEGGLQTMNICPDCAHDLHEADYGGFHVVYCLDCPYKHQETRQIVEEIEKRKNAASVPLRDTHSEGTGKRGQSTLEAEFAMQMALNDVEPWEQEYRFCPSRKWRFDFCWIDKMLAVELEGGVYTQGRHTRGAGFTGDCEKQNAAVLLGFRVLRFTGEQVKSGYALETIEKALKGET